MGKGIKYGLCVLAGAVVLAVATAAVPPPDGFRMGRNMEVLVNMLRDISLFYVDDVDPDELLSDAAAGMTAVQEERWPHGRGQHPQRRARVRGSRP